MLPSAAVAGLEGQGMGLVAPTTEGGGGGGGID